VVHVQSGYRQLWIFPEGNLLELRLEGGGRRGRVKLVAKRKAGSRNPGFEYLVCFQSLRGLKRRQLRADESSVDKVDRTFHTILFHPLELNERFESASFTNKNPTMFTNSFFLQFSPTIRAFIGQPKGFFHSHYRFVKIQNGTSSGL
jgi:hypothetical protein